MAAITTDGANIMDGTKVLEAGGQSKMGAGGSRKKNRSRSASASSVDSVSSGSYTGIYTIDLISYIGINLFPKDQAPKMMTNLRENLIRRIVQEARTSVSKRFPSTLMDDEKFWFALIFMYNHFVN